MRSILIPIQTVLCSLTAALLYTAGVLLLKRSTDWKPGPWRSTLLCNLAAAIVFLPMLAWGEPLTDWGILWQPALVGVFFVIGQAGVVLAVTHGDVSLATPLLGLKILIVAALLWGFVGVVPSIWIWPAAVLAVVAVACLSYQGKKDLDAESDANAAVKRRKVALTITLSIVAAIAYAVFDTLIQVWAPRFSAATFLPLVMLSSALLSLAMVPLLEGPVRSIDKSAWPWLLGGAFLTSLQSVFLTFAIGTWGHAAAANVVYSSRGLWSVLAISLIGSYFSKAEYAAPKSVKRMRLVGACLITVAIAMVL